MKGKKIAIVTISLNFGGLERSCINLYDLLTDLGHKVEIICLSPEVDFEFEGSLYYVKNRSNSKLFSRIHSFYKLRKHLKNKNFDYIIDNRIRTSSFKELIYLHYIYRDISTIYMVHSSKTDHYFPKLKIVAKYMINKSFKTITVSNGIKEKLIKLYHTPTNIITTYNYIKPIPRKPHKTDLPSNQYILFLGRLEDSVKNITLLLESYKISKLYPENDLYIVGSGPDRDLINQKVGQLKLDQSVKLFSFTHDIAHFITNAKYLILTSRYEGFGMVLVESLSLGTPVISVDCQFGPNEIIIPEKNGLLVENNNPQQLAKAMIRFYKDEYLYSICKNNAINSVRKFGKKEISVKWSELLK